ALSVDANGDVILVPAPGMCTSFSNASPVNYFSKWTGTGPNIICDSRMYEDNATKNVAVDWDGTAIDAKLRVKYISSNGTPNGISCKLTAGSGTGTAIGILSNVVGTSGATNYFGVRSVATGNTGSNLVYGVYGKAVGTTSTLGSPANFGVYGYATGGGIGQNVGVYGKVDVAGDWAGWFQGDVNVTGVGFIPGGVWSVSDKTIKTDIVPIENVDEILSQLTGYTYEFDNSIHPSLPLPKGEQIGVISQELALVLPQLVKRINLPAVYDTLGVMISDTFSVLSVNYEGLIPVLVEGYKSQQKKIEDLQSQIVGCCSTKMKTANDDGASPANQIVELKTAATNYLGQSVPNPHGSQCTIPYSIDANVTNAEIVFVDELGRVIQRVEIVTLGKGQLTVLSSNLEDGVYNYSLVLDNKIIDTKKMLKQH
ncbi:MAG: tail fiber domain-containing protein, partial [Chitinophagales bacterium]|nr:tail fiber domain-containing protein [Chitinophagales bacterium]